MSARVFENRCPRIISCSPIHFIAWSNALTIVSRFFTINIAASHIAAANATGHPIARVIVIPNVARVHVTIPMIHPSAARTQVSATAPTAIHAVHFTTFC